MVNGTVHYFKINKAKTKYSHIGISNNPSPALEWAKSVNADMNHTSEPTNCCHCGLLDVGVITELGVVKEVYHTAPNLVTVLI